MGSSEYYILQAPAFWHARLLFNIAVNYSITILHTVIFIYSYLNAEFYIHTCTLQIRLGTIVFEPE